MKVRALLAFLAAGACALPAAATAGPAAEDRPAADGPEIRSITLHPAEPVVRPGDAVRLVIDVVARGTSGPDGVTIQVGPGEAPEAGAGRLPSPGPSPGPSSGAGPESGPAPSADGAPPPGSAPWPGRESVGPAGRESAGQEWATWRFLPEKRLSRWYPAGRWTITATARGSGGAEAVRHAGFWLKRETVFSAVRAAGEGRGVRVEGVLNRVDPQGYTDYAPFAGASVQILHRRTDGDAWEEAAAAVTDRLGYFARKVRERRRGDWRIRFPGTSRFASGLSRTIHIGKRDK
ncbi:hypothetical protein [Planomonospora venezuelensis]|uniref:Uncharacterized protein n=1 Tax=Planomonospora venezuelensis TaxID=1999 RepID=A0A841D325_PLAVE|nr:hypothetical protein [Planomonospora venezuelensis]MBB5963373.1 hypothetical protein [Planomonospora venezuelensis]GIN05234.1 hypothetical protein Pve01_68920 [Planomonospora venezuelensis]